MKIKRDAKRRKNTEQSVRRRDAGYKNLARVITHETRDAIFTHRKCVRKSSDARHRCMPPEWCILVFVQSHLIHLHRNWFWLCSTTTGFFLSWDGRTEKLFVDGRWSMDLGIVTQQLLPSTGLQKSGCYWRDKRLWDEYTLHAKPDASQISRWITVRANYTYYFGRHFRCDRHICQLFLSLLVFAFYQTTANRFASINFHSQNWIKKSNRVAIEMFLALLFT